MPVCLKLTGLLITGTAGVIKDVYCGSPASLMQSAAARAVPLRGGENVRIIRKKGRLFWRYFRARYVLTGKKRFF